MKYAPIMITTLNRKTHLERCLLSLSKNTDADKTDVFVSVDYPPSKKYEEGYKAVIDFLKNSTVGKEFKSFTVIYQKENLGPSGNSKYLRELICSKYDRYISTEDDNEFSTNFIQYMNSGLDIFENNMHVTNICGCKDTEYVCAESNVLASKLYPAYGVGSWCSKEEQLRLLIPQKLLDRKTYSKYNLLRLKKQNRVLFNIYMTEVLLGNRKLYWNDGELNIIDSVRSLYFHFTDSYCIVPAISKSRTWGNDGTGVNMKNREDIDPKIKWPLDSEKQFTYCVAGEIIKNKSIYNETQVDFIEENYEIGNRYMNTVNTLKFNLKADIYYALLALCNFNLIKAKKIKEKLFI